MITLQQIRDKKPCREGWGKLLAWLGYTDGNYDPNCQVTLGDVAVSNGAVDAWWCVRCLDPTDAVLRRRVVRALLPALRRAAAHTKDMYVADCLDAVARWADGDDTIILETSVRLADASGAVAYIVVYATDAAYGAHAAWAAAEFAAKDVYTAAFNAAYVAGAAFNAADVARAAYNEERTAQAADIIAEFGLTQTRDKDMLSEPQIKPALS